MNTFKKIFVAVLAGLALSSCVTNELVPDFAQKNVAFGKKVLNVAKQGETQVVAINSNADWTLSTDAEWVKLAPMSGTSATKSITVTVDEENTTGDVRTAKVIIASVVDASQCDTLTVNQSNAEAGGKIVDAETFLLFMEAALSFTEADVVEVAADVDLGGIEITPAAKFAGVLEGNDHSIYNFTVNSTLSAASLIVENTGTIKNLKIGTANGTTPDGKTVFTFASGAEGSAAGIVGINSGLMENVSNFATVNFNATNPASTDAGIGGVAGLFGGPNAKLVNCHNYGAVTFTGTLNYRGMMGGVLGLNAQAGTEVSSCVNHADLIQASKTQKEFTMGGVIGRSNTQMYVKDCVNEGAVTYSCTEKPGSYLHIAGIIGAEYSGAEISNCVNKGPVSSCIDQVNRMGGIVGTMNSNGKVINCRNEASLTLEQPTNANWQSVGGIVGFEEKCTLVGEEKGGSISGSVNNGIITVKVDNATTHANQVCAGGVIGITCSHFAVTGNTNNANISFTNTSGSNTQVGGIVGWDKTTASIVEDNENKGDVTVSAANGFAGGILGKADVAASSVKNNTNLGTITGTTAGSIAGSAEAALTSCAVGGTVNGVVLSEGNFGSYIQGAGSGVPVSCYFPGGSAPQDYLVAAPASVSFVAAGESKDINVNANCEWTAVSSESWLTLSVATGNGDAVVTLTAAENTAKTPRTATVTISSKADATLKAEVAVTQAEKVDGLAGNKIASAADFKAFLALAPNVAEGESFTLEADVDMGGETLVTPASFAGVLDGQNHKVYNFNAVGGVFAANSGTIKNLIFGASGSAYDGKSTVTTDADLGHQGLIAVNSGNVENVKNYAKIEVTAASNVAQNGLGGIVGYSTAGNITSCINYGEVVLNDKVTIAQEIRVGGVVGRASGEQTISNCINKAPLIVTTKTNKVIMMGGLAGVIQLKASVVDCSNEAPIEYNQVVAPGTWMAVGGVLGALYTQASISGSSNSGKVSSNLAQVVRIAGITAVMNSGGSCSGCTNTGAIELTQPTNANWQAAGGIVGFEEKGTADAPIVIKNNINKGTVSVSLDNTTTHANRAAAGGIIGTSCSVVELTANTNEANVSIANANTTAVYAGGVVGWYRSGTALSSSENVNSGAVKAEGTSNYAGGVIGSANTTGCVLTSDKNTAAVVGVTAGAIAGENNGQLVKCMAGGTVNGAAAAPSNIQGAGAGSHTDDVIL